MVAGVVLGKLIPSAVAGLRSIEFAKGSQINAPIVVLIWFMITPMMMKVDFSSVRNVGKRPAGDAFHQLVGQALFYGALCLGLLPCSVRAFHLARGSRSIHSGLHHPCRCTLHGHGLCLEPSHE